MKTRSDIDIADLYIRNIVRIIDNEGKFYILVGNYQVCEKTFKTREEAITYVNNSTSEIIINITLLLQELKKQENGKVNR